MGLPHVYPDTGPKGLSDKSVLANLQKAHEWGLLGRT